MTEAFDPLWQAAAQHVLEAGLQPKHVLAPAGFHALLPGCWSVENAPYFTRLGAVIIHKGRLDEVPIEHLLDAMKYFVPTFASEVFVIYSHRGEPVAADSPHLMDRHAMILESARALGRKSARFMRTARAPATYMGGGRVLLDTAFGHLMLVDGEDTAIAPHLIRDGWFDRDLTDMIGALLEPGMTFIDVGANFGTYTLIGAQRVWPSGRVVAVEPAPNIAKLLFENIAMNGFEPFAKVERCALGEAEGTLTLHEFASRQGSNTMLAKVAETAVADYGEMITKREVACRTLDAVVAEHSLERVDLVKIDVEGFEQQVLSGARETISRFRPRLIVEWHAAFFEDRPDDARALYDMLTGELGYHLKRIKSGATAYAVDFDKLMASEHSDLVAEPRD